MRSIGLVVRKAAFEIRLELYRAADHVPEHVFELRIQSET